MSGSFREIYTEAISGASASAIFMVMSGWSWGLAQQNADQRIVLTVISVLLFLTGFFGAFFSLTAAIERYSCGSLGRKVLGYFAATLLVFSVMVLIGFTVVQGWNAVGSR
ncbi:hypothetical protein ACFOZ5_00020 [Marinobacter lacisalsi]|uniref:Uncharacterized protein n=1 Tax=Marinobacter lacisalsi TaxID=475979 RepID=A0ABV8QCK9_9GAMM